MLTPKNVHALRTLFNVAHRLHHLLGPAWVLVLDILNTLDRILQSPRTTTQVQARKLYSRIGGGEVEACFMVGCFSCNVQRCMEKLFFSHHKVIAGLVLG